MQSLFTTPSLREILLAPLPSLLPSTESESTTQNVVPKVLKLDKAFQLAELWVNDMSGGTAAEKNTDLGTESHPARLGLGARITPNAQRTPSTDPVERKLLQKVITKRKQNSEDEEKVNTTEKNKFQNDDDTDEPESRTTAIVKMRPMPLPAASLVKRQK